jgi:DNA replicative helicase MCM subunit Mcm2 (Cdc46/Mcm family)|tara:strand:+ start:379 stop:2097 length:1719 start_codon:yes stop_codon:yes gene_type:complete
MIPKAIHDFVKKMVDGKHSLKKEPIVEQQANVLSIIETLVSGSDSKGSGVVTKREVKGVSTKDSGKDRTLIRFGISDGENLVSCVAHNCDMKYLGGKLPTTQLEKADTIIRKSLAEGKPIKVKGLYANFKQERTFVIDSIEWAEDVHKSQLEQKHIDAFLKVCKSEGTTPLEVMMDDAGLWAEIYADQDLKKAILLYCLSPFEKEDMIHIGLITNPGEGKNHLVDKVITPLVRCRMAGTGKLSTFAGMFGAMSSDDLSSIELGLLPKMNNDRIIFSEFQTLEEDVFGEMLNVMTDGHYNLQKGKLDVTRHAMLNMAFFGNPPNYWREDDHKKEEMLAAFGKYTLPIISRLTLIFAKPTLSNGVDASNKIKQKILHNMDKTSAKGTDKEQIANLRSFFREYLKYVSRLQPKLGLYEATITSEFERLEITPEFKDAFAKRGKTDYRKWAELLNLIKGFARLNGRNKLRMEDIDNALELFQDSLETLTNSFSRIALQQGINHEMIELHRSILNKFGDGSGQASGKRSEIAKFAKSFNRGKEWDALCKIKLPDGSMLIEDFVDSLIIKPNWDGDEP